MPVAGSLLGAAGEKPAAPFDFPGRGRRESETGKGAKGGTKGVGDPDDVGGGIEGVHRKMFLEWLRQLAVHGGDRLVGKAGESREPGLTLKGEKVSDQALALSMTIQQCMYVIGNACNRDLLQQAASRLEALEGESLLTKRAKEFLGKTAV